MIVDTHAHFWNEVPKSMGFDAADPAPFPVEDLLRDMQSVGVDKVIQVTRSFVGFDNSTSLEGAAKYPNKIRVVGRFDAALPDMPGRLRTYASHPYVVGLRLMTMFPAEAPWWDDGTLDKFWPEAERLGLPIAVYAPERSKMIGEIAARHPGLTLLVEHLGMRTWNLFKSPPSLDDWDNFLALRSRPNITLKVTAAPEVFVEKSPFPKSQTRLKEVYDHFGPDRMMWGSNYPRCLQMHSYQDALDLIQVHCTFLTDHDKSRILGGTAASVFKLAW